VHDICFVRFGTETPELCPFLKLLYPYRESLCLKLLQQFSSHLYFIFFMVFLISFDKVKIMGVYSSQSVIILYLINSDDEHLFRHLQFPYYMYM